VYNTWGDAPACRRRAERAFVGAASKEKTIFKPAEKKWLRTQFAMVCSATGEREKIRLAFAAKFPASAMLPLEWPPLSKWMESEVEKTMKTWLEGQVAERVLGSNPLLTSELQTDFLDCFAARSLQAHLPHLTAPRLQKLWKQAPLKGSVDPALQPPKARGGKRKAAAALDEPDAAAGAAAAPRKVAKKLPEIVDNYVNMSIKERLMVMDAGKDAARGYFSVFLRQQVPPLEVDLEDVVHKWFERQRAKMIRTDKLCQPTPPPAGELPPAVDIMDAAGGEAEEDPAAATAGATGAAAAALAAEHAAPKAAPAEPKGDFAAAATAAEAAPAGPEGSAAAAASAAIAADAPLCCTKPDGLFSTFGENQVRLYLKMLEESERSLPFFHDQYQSRWKNFGTGEKLLSKGKLQTVPPVCLTKSQFDKLTLTL